MTILLDEPQPTHDDGRICTVDDLPGWFTLHYQPEIDLATDRIVGCEALLRWSRPEFGLCDPEAALQHSSRESVLASVESWSLRAALRQARVWADEGRAVPVAVNLTRGRVEDPRLADDIAAALEETGVPGSLLAIDIPMIEFTKAPVPTARLAADLRELGVEVIADGVVGDRYASSIEPAEPGAFKVPIRWSDRFHTEAHPLMASAVALADEIGATTVAKDVATQEQLGAVRRLGFRRAFGSAISDAVEPDLLPVSWDPGAEAAA